MKILKEDVFTSPLKGNKDEHDKVDFMSSRRRKMYFCIFCFWQIAGSVAISQPMDACASLTNSNETNGKIVLVNRGSCTFGSKVIELLMFFLF